MVTLVITLLRTREKPELLNQARLHKALRKLTDLIGARRAARPSLGIELSYLFFDAEFEIESVGGEIMKKGFRMTSSLLLGAALLAPVAMSAQDRDRDRDRDDRTANNYRVYDSAHRQYHTWNQDEDQAYRGWYGQTYNGRQYRDYRKLNKKQQQAYWKWRHDHNDRDHDRDDRH